MTSVEKLLESIYQKQDAELNAKHEAEREALRLKQFQTTEIIHSLVKTEPRTKTQFVKVLKECLKA